MLRLYCRTAQVRNTFVKHLSSFFHEVSVLLCLDFVVFVKPIMLLGLPCHPLDRRELAFCDKAWVEDKLIFTNLHQ